MDENNIGDINPQSLPLSKKLADQLEAWSKVYDLTLNKEDPNYSGFSSQAEKQAYEDQGIELWRQLDQELSEDYDVYYFSILQQIVIKNPESLPHKIAAKSS